MIAPCKIAFSFALNITITMQIIETTVIVADLADIPYILTNKK